MRLVVALLLGISGVLALSLVVEQFDAAPKRTNRAQPASGPASLPVLENPSAVRSAQSAARRGVAGLGLRLQPVSGTIVLARSVSAIPPDVAPVVEVLANGELVLRRPPPLAQGPGLAAEPSAAGHGAGIVLPAADLARLTGRSRAGLVELIRRWVAERPVAPERLAASGIGVPSQALLRLLQWVP